MPCEQHPSPIRAAPHALTLGLLACCTDCCQGPHPNLLQAQQLLTSADAHLAQASSLLTRATASQAAQTGAQMAGGRRGMTLTGEEAPPNICSQDTGQWLPVAACVKH